MASTSKKTEATEGGSEFPTDWDIDSYFQEHELEEHWLLRRKFIEAHKDKFPEERLVCLAQVFTNVEFLGCKYPDETMGLVAELSEDLAKEFREQRAQKLQRFSVMASNAAEDLIKGRREAQQRQQRQQRQSSQYDNVPGTSSDFIPNRRRKFETDGWQQPQRPQQMYQQVQQWQQQNRQQPGFQQQWQRPQQQQWRQDSQMQQQQQQWHDKNSNRQYQQGGGHYQQGGGQYQQGGGQYQQRGGQYPQGSGQYQQAGGRHQQGVGRYQQGMGHQGDGQYQQGRGRYPQGDEHYPQSGGGYQQGHGRYQEASEQCQQRKPQLGGRPSRSNLFDGMRFGKFVLFLIGGRNCLRFSAQRCKIEYLEKDLDVGTTKKKVEIYLNDELVASATDTNLKASKTEAFWQAFKVLQCNCYSIKPNAQRDTIKIEKSNNQVVCGVTKQQDDTLDDKKLDANNKGYKMMKLMGWGGDGLGSNQQGRKEPVGYLLKNNRAGLGNDTCKLDRNYFKQMLQNYVDSEDIRELQFESSFTKEERALLHEIAGTFNLKSNSHGKAESRRLIISKKNISNEKILNEVLFRKNSNYSDQYHVQVPESKEKQYPEHTTKLELDMQQI